MRETVKNDIAEELNKGLEKAIDEGFGPLYQLGTDIIENAKTNNN